MVPVLLLLLPIRLCLLIDELMLASIIGLLHPIDNITVFRTEFFLKSAVMCVLVLVPDLSIAVKSRVFGRSESLTRRLLVVVYYLLVDGRVHFGGLLWEKLVVAGDSRDVIRVLIDLTLIKDSQCLRLVIILIPLTWRIIHATNAASLRSREQLLLLMCHVLDRKGRSSSLERLLHPWLVHLVLLTSWTKLWLLSKSHW